MNRLRKPAAPVKGEMAEAACRQQAELAAYIVEMTAELARLAGAADLPMLAYFLNLARVEAQISVREQDLAELRRGA